ncbi:lipopolysaccharide biosynthesis protein [Vreelandella maris]|uniref:Lipopolysaccharide biosynthesis protein n=1 Tax=Vreelandella maris TaxID=2729617 RepID=A0A7Y6RBV8_9GAMM|nr:hypothetical protein [Halomonas maris]NVF13659.1 hypothetical protein [Halomonas maris]
MKRHVYRLLPKSRIGRSIAVLMSGTAVAQAMTAVSMPIVTRLYTPEMIGVISVYLSFFNFWLTLLTWRYESALLIAEDEQESHHIFRLGAILALITALLAIPVLSGLQYTGTLGFEVLPPWAPLVLFMSLLGYGWFMLYRCWLLRLQEVRIITMSTIARAGANAGARIALGGLSFGMYGLFIAEVLGSWSALGAVRKKTKKLLKTPIPIWSLGSLKQAAIRYKKFAQYEMPSAVVNQMAIALPVPIVGMLYGASAAGWFGLARLLYAIPNGQIGKTAGDVFQMELGSLVREGDYKKGEKLFYKFSIRLTCVGLVPLLLAIFLAPRFVPYIFGKDWSGMGDIVAHMAPWMFMSLVVGSMSRALSVLQKQQWKLLYDASALSVVLVAFFLARENKLDLINFVDVLSSGMVLAYIVYFLVISLTIKKMSARSLK